MDFTVLPPHLCSPRRAGGARTRPARELRASLNSAHISRPDATADPSTSSPAAARTPPYRALRVGLNPSCVSRPSAWSATAAAAAKKPKRPGLSGDGDPTSKRLSAAGDGKENKNAPAATAAASKVGTVLLPCSRADEEHKLPLGKTTTRLRGVTADCHAAANVAPAPVVKRKATPADSKIAVPRPCSRGDEASRLLLGNTARLRGAAAAEGHAAPASLAKRKVAPSASEPAKRRTPPAAASAASPSPSPRSADSGGTVRELLATARTATDAIRRREIEQLRAASLRELDRVVRTVEFNDPFISPQDVLR